MTPPPAPAPNRINLQGASVLLVEASYQGMGVLSQIFKGLGATDAYRSRDAASAMEILGSRGIDLIVADTNLPDVDGYAFVRDLRRAKGNPNCFAPVILVTGHTQLNTIKTARDCGANFIIAKPLTPKVVLDRVIWVSREARPFIETAEYLGPDRRFKTVDLPPGKVGRRSGDRPTTPTQSEPA